MEPTGLSAATPESPPAAAQRRSLSRAVLLRVASVLVGLVVACLVLEIALRVLDVDPTRLVTKRMLERTDLETLAYYECYSSNPNDEFRPLPDWSVGEWQLTTLSSPVKWHVANRIRETPWCVEYRLSSLRLRHPEIAAAPAPGVVRALVVGDSFVFGEGVPVEKTLTVQMAELLGPSCELINVGWPGWSTSDEVEATEQFVPDLGASRAIVVFTANDVEQTPELARQQNLIHDLINIRDARLGERTSQAWYAGRSRLLRFVGGSLEMRRIARETIDWYRDLYNPTKNSDNLARLEDDFRRLAERTDCQTVLVLYPLMEGLERDYPLAEVHAQVAELARSAGLPVLDLAPTFAGKRTSSLWVHEADHHPNGRAHSIAARAIVDWLKREHPGFLAPAATASQP